MSKGDDEAMVADLFAVQISGDSNNYAAEGFCNAYAEASQASASSRAPILIDGRNPNRTDECAAIGVTDGGDRERKAIVAIDHVEAAGLGAKSGKDNSWSGGHQRRCEAARLMTVKDVAAYLSMSDSKVWRLEEREVGFPKPIRIGGSTRWDRCAIDRYLDSLQAAGHSGH